VQTQSPAEIATGMPGSPADPDFDLAIRVKNVDVDYRTIVNPRANTLRHTLTGLGRRSSDRKVRMIHAVRGVSFDVPHGSVLGIIGANGAGKSTIMRAIAGILPPSQGEIVVNGRISTLLALGVGFNGQLSGRGGVKETAFSGVFPTVRALRERGAEVTVADPMYTDEELRALGFEPYPAGSPVDAAIIQTDHAEYRRLSPEDLPGIKTLIDGRRVTDAAAWAGVRRRLIGAGGR
jgi:hypothetical protein